MHFSGEYSLVRYPNIKQPDIKSNPTGPIAPATSSAGKWWQTTEYTIHKCRFTDNRLYINNSESRVLIVPVLDKDSAVIAAKEALEGAKNLFGNRAGKDRENLSIENKNRIYISLDRIIQDCSISALGELMDIVVDRANNLTNIKTDMFRRFCFNICYHFWFHGVIALPVNSKVFVFNSIRLLNSTIKGTPPGYLVMNTIRPNIPIITHTIVIFKSISFVTGFKSHLDLDNDIMNYILNNLKQEFAEPYTNTSGNFAEIFWTGVERSIFRSNPELATKLVKPNENNTIKAELISSEGIDEWLKLGVEYLSKVKHNIRQKKVAVNSFIQFVLEHDEIPKSPKLYFDKNKHIKVHYHCDSTRGILAVYNFLEWAFNETVCIIDDNGAWVCIDAKRYAIPMPKPKRLPGNNKTIREVMPAKLVGILREIILANNFEWPKSLKSDYFINGKGEEVWFPGRAIGALLKLSIPCRTKQLLTMSSGEGDTWRYESDGPYELSSGLVAGKWIRNSGVHAPPLGELEISEGTLRREPKWNQEEHACYLFFNNNKTADLNRDVSEHGYVMPWDHAEAQGYIIYLRDWQETQNPAHDRYPWVNVEWLTRDRDLQVLKNKKDYFLFRDPCNRKNGNPMQAMSPGRLVTFWSLLMAEAERRMNITDGTPVNPSPHKLILSWDRRNRIAAQPVSPKYDMHSMRVTILSYLHDNGVPLEFLRQLAGHSSLVMTAYYSVINPEKMTDILAKATATWKGKTGQEWGQYLKHVGREHLRELLVAKDDAVLERVFQGDREGLVVKDHGCCLVGESMCDVGMESYSPDGDKVFLPVPGGKSNCVRCRFFCTGPAWLPGLAAHFNWLTLRLTKESRLLDPAQAAFQAIQREYLACIRECRTFTEHQTLEKARPAYDTANVKTNEVGHSWQATYQLIEACRELVRRERENPTEGMSLVVPGGVEAMEFALRQSHSTDLLATICATGNLYAGVSQPNEANQDLCCVLDRLLFNNGIQGLLVTLEDEERRAAMLEIYKWLRQRTPSNDQYAAIVECRATLESLGFQWEFVEKLRTMEPFLARLPEVKVNRKGKQANPKVNDRERRTLTMKEVDHADEG